MVTSEQLKMRNALGDALISMLCEAFNYKLDLEDTIDKQETQMKVSSNSKADYACWVLQKVDATNREDVCTVIVEVKHLKSIKDDNIAQVLGYYCKSRGVKDTNQPGVNKKNPV